MSHPCHAESPSPTDAKALAATVAAAFLRAPGTTVAARLFRETVAESRWADAPAADRLHEVSRRLNALSARRHHVGDALKRAAHAIAAARAQGIRLTVWDDPAYPEWLRHIPDPPIVLWSRGDVRHLNRPAVAVVGSRAVTPAGSLMATRLGEQIAGVGLVVVSGLARGVDSAAHRGAVNAEGLTIAVLGSGVDVIYPPEHAPLAAQIARQGVVMSELPPGTPPLPGHFPLRNRIISGLSRAVVVVEASERSGSLITAKAALEQGRCVLAVPGSPASGRYRGCHALIKDGARLVETVEDVLEEIGWIGRRQDPDTPSHNPQPINGLEVTMAAGERYTVDDLAVRTGRTASALLADLGALELAGRVARTPGGTYVRLDGPAMDSRTAVQGRRT
jgi:DNA processing protein